MKEKKHLDTESSSSTDEDSKARRMKIKREKPECDYYRALHHENYFFRNNMDIMTKLLEENNIYVPYFARRGERKPSLDKKDGKCLYALGAREKPISHIYILDISIYDLHFYISEYETSIPSLEETPNSSPKFPPKNSHFSLVFDLSSESSFPLHSDPSYPDSKGDIHDYIHPMTFIDSFTQPFHAQKT